MSFACSSAARTSNASTAPDDATAALTAALTAFSANGICSRLSGKRAFNFEAAARKARASVFSRSSSGSGASLTELRLSEPELVASAGLRRP